ncbi:hypothetical protein KAW64_16660 [bacterium]|nr:hypothetical protein [bacterium]
MTELKTVETLGDVLMAKWEELDELSGSPEQAVEHLIEMCGLADARIIRLCPTCGGSRSAPVAEDFPGGDKSYDVTCSPCLDCADAPTWMITPEAREAFVAVIEGGVTIHYDEVGYITHVTSDEATADMALQALLPGARVALRIMTVERDGWREGGHFEGGCLRDEGLALLPLRPGTVVAVLSEPEGGNTDTRARHVCTECGRLGREGD